MTIAQINAKQYLTAVKPHSVNVRLVVPGFKRAPRGVLQVPIRLTITMDDWKILLVFRNRRP